MTLKLEKINQGQKSIRTPRRVHRLIFPMVACLEGCAEGAWPYDRTENHVEASACMGRL